ncbi:aldehyde dehydrogenase family protein [Streptomyces sp. B3I8]|uniref:aldehyde dehydrogenase family protein n=1 Tax=Streptomyces sp. B3I8 TaxID=3042303 RepID=UPI00277D1B11|nr:aldehyde dehydrogenase family protein [Streptomyces sp. B3I8]MDQ0784949.1 acyl-CoA reductase-like NAD-dependent aldehyde dehydrogenase [Streptomyces sp. B3I8]
MAITHDTTLHRPHVMTINGQPVEGAATFGVVDPSTGDVFAQAPDCTPEQLDAAMRAAQLAQPPWAQDEDARRRALLTAADLLEAHADDLARILIREQGRPASFTGEMDLVVAWLRYFGNVEMPREVLIDNDTEFIEKVHKPLGVVAAIAPWNAPLMLAMWKIAPALRAGNTVVLKPSPYTPLSTLAMGELLQSVVPAGVLNVVSGLDPLGARMVEHPVPRKVSFTGSTATGKKVAASAANSLKRVTLELGGNDPAIVLPDADPAAIADRLFWGGFVNSGQICLAVKRVYVHSTIRDRLVEELAARARAAVVGGGFDPRTTLGPLTNAMQRDKVAHLVSAAIDDGAVAVTGGEAPSGQGYFYPPTILTNAKDGMAVVDEEQFGPVMPIVAYDDLDAVIEQVNTSPFGLTASVWSTDLDAAARVAARLDAGQVTINAHANGLRPYLPFSGHKESGIGVENALEGLAEYTSTTVLIRPKPTS